MKTFDKIFKLSVRDGAISEALKRRHEGAELTTNDKPLTRNYDSDKEKSEIDSDIRVLKNQTATYSAFGQKKLHLLCVV